MAETMNAHECHMDENLRKAYCAEKADVQGTVKCTGSCTCWPIGNYTCLPLRVKQIDLFPLPARIGPKRDINFELVGNVATVRAVCQASAPDLQQCTSLSQCAVG